MSIYKRTNDIPHRKLTKNRNGLHKEKHSCNQPCEKILNDIRDERYANQLISIEMQCRGPQEGKQWQELSRPLQAGRC